MTCRQQIPPWVRRLKGRNHDRAPPLGDFFSCLIIRLQRSDDGSMGSVTSPSRSARRSRHCETILRNAGSLSMRLSASAASCSDRWPSTYFPARIIIFSRCIPRLLSVGVLALERGPTRPTSSRVTTTDGRSPGSRVVTLHRNQGEGPQVWQGKRRRGFKPDTAAGSQTKPKPHPPVLGGDTDNIENRFALRKKAESSLC